MFGWGFGVGTREWRGVDGDGTAAGNSFSLAPAARASSLKREPWGVQRGWRNMGDGATAPHTLLPTPPRLLPRLPRIIRRRFSFDPVKHFGKVQPVFVPDRLRDRRDRQILLRQQHARLLDPEPGQVRFRRLLQHRAERPVQMAAADPDANNSASVLYSRPVISTELASPLPRAS